MILKTKQVLFSCNFIQFHSNCIRRADFRAAETGNLLPARPDAGRPRRVRTVQVEERILRMIDTDPTASTRSIAKELNLKSHVTVHQALKGDHLYPFHYTPVQNLEATDFENRENFCRWLLRRQEEDNEFTSNILWTDESLFTRDGMFNYHNSRVWSHKPKAQFNILYKNNFINISKINQDPQLKPHV